MPARPLLVSVAGLFLLSTAWAASKKPEWVDAGAPAYPAVDASVVRTFKVYGGLSHELPDGMDVHQGKVQKTSERIDLVPNYPTPEDPHAFLGGLVIERGRLGDAELLVTLQEAAAEHGGDLVVLASESREEVQVALVYHLGTGAPPPDPRPASAMLALSTKGLPGFAPAGEPVRMPMSATTTVQIEGKRGSCYAVAFANEPDGRYTRAAREYVRVISSVDGVGITGGARSTVTPDFRGDLGVLGCPQNDQALLVDVVSTWGMNNKDATPHNLGTGTLVVQVYTKAIGDADLAQRAAAEAESLRKAHEASRRLSEKACGACWTAAFACGADPANCSAYQSCLSRHAARPSDCGY